MRVRDGGNVISESNGARSNQALCDAIATRIQQHPQARITFADYMDWVLYHPQYGYYTRPDATLGPRGDFMTSSHLGQDFAELLAQQFVEMWYILGQPHPFHLVEMGAGQGLVARDILSYLQQQFPDCFGSLVYTIVETSPVLIAEQQRQLHPWLEGGVVIRWQSLDSIPANSITGCCFSNELLDAFPVHRVMLTTEGLQEIYVTLAEATSDPAGSPFAETVAALSTPKLREYFQWFDVDWQNGSYPEGYCTEVNLAVFDWLEAVMRCLRRGYLLTIDYGYTADRYYSPMRSQGTLQAYYRHNHHNDPYCYVGYQDLTTHVNFTALKYWGNLRDLDTLGFTQQGLFLMALGLGDRLTALSQIEATDALTIQTSLRQRDALHQLISPLGLGNFGVLIQCKGLGKADKMRPLKGLTIPPLG